MRLPLLTVLLLGLSGINHLQANGMEPKVIMEEPLSYEPGQLLVKFRSSSTVQAYHAAILPLGQVQPVAPDLALIQLDQTVSMQSALEDIQQQEGVEFVQPNYRYYATALPSDPDLGQLWGFVNNGQEIYGAAYGLNNPTQLPGYDIDAEQAWDWQTDCRFATVAILDTGVNYSHQDLKDNMWQGAAKHGWDFISNDNDPMPEGGLEDHGTHVAGIIAATGDNGIGGTGVCWQAQIMALRVLNEKGIGTSAGIIQAIYWAIENGARILNMSLGGTGSFDPAFSAAITAAADANIAVIVAAGNNGDDIDALETGLWPCNFTQDNLICVTALDQAAQLASFSNSGAVSVDVGAPGTNIRSTWSGPFLVEDSQEGWQTGPGWQWLPAGDCATEPLLVNPSLWCSNGAYANAQDSRSYKAFNFAGTERVALRTLVNFDLETNRDFIEFAFSARGADPFQTGQVILYGTGKSPGFIVAQSELSGCNRNGCSVGVRLRTNPAVSAKGVALARFELGSLQMDTNSHRVVNGTSMATPVVTGIAALLLSYNPELTAVDVVRAIREGGAPQAALNGITSTGKAVNAMGALSYLKPPQGLKLGRQRQ